MTRSPIRFGIIGAGPNASGHARYFKKSDRSEVVAIADPDTARATALAEEVGARPLADYREFLDEVDAVVISSPNHFHCEQAVTCAEAGKHIYCEKPMGINLAEAEQMTAAMNKAGVKSAIGFSVRWGKGFPTMTEQAQSGALGRVITIWSRRMAHLGRGLDSSSGSWRGDPAKSGGLLMEVNIHEIDWIMATGGEVSSVYARTTANNSEHPRANDHLSIIINFENGAVGTHTGSWHCAAADYCRGVVGLDKVLYTDQWSTKLFEAANERDAEHKEIENLQTTDKHAEFLDAIQNDGRSIVDVNWGLKVMRVTEAIYQSANENAVIPVTNG